MHAQDEVKAFAVVTDHLQQRFPRVPEGLISAVVAAERQRLAAARVRDYVPLLVERAAASHLSRVGSD